MYHGEHRYYCQVGMPIKHGHGEPESGSTSRIPHTLVGGLHRHSACFAKQPLREVVDRGCRCGITAAQSFCPKLRILSTAAITSVRTAGVVASRPTKLPNVSPRLSPTLTIMNRTRRSMVKWTCDRQLAALGLIPGTRAHCWAQPPSRHWEYRVTPMRARARAIGRRRDRNSPTASAMGAIWQMVRSWGLTPADGNDRLHCHRTRQRRFRYSGAVGIGMALVMRAGLASVGRGSGRNPNRWCGAPRRVQWPMRPCGRLSPTWFRCRRRRGFLGRCACGRRPG